MSEPQPNFDGDLAAGLLREDAFARVLLGGRELWEHKRDFKCVKTGNIAIEYETSTEPYGEGKRYPSGIAKSQAYWLIVEYMEDCRLILPTEKVKGLARTAIREGHHHWIGDDNRFHNALVPIEWFLRPLRLSS